MSPVNQNTAATDGKPFPKTGKKLPDAPNGGGTVERPEVRCACQRRAPYDCWRLRYPRPSEDDDELTSVRMEGGPCECPCHDEFACEDEGDWF